MFIKARHYYIPQYINCSHNIILHSLRTVRNVTRGSSIVTSLWNTKHSCKNVIQRNQRIESESVPCIAMWTSMNEKAIQCNTMFARHIVAVHEWCGLSNFCIRLMEVATALAILLLSLASSSSVIVFYMYTMLINIYSDKHWLAMVQSYYNQSQYGLIMWATTIHMHGSYKGLLVFGNHAHNLIQAHIGCGGKLYRMRSNYDLATSLLAHAWSPFII